MDTINQSFPIVVDKPAGDLGADADILPVVLLGAPGKKERDTVIHRVDQMAARLMDVRQEKGVKLLILSC